MDLINEILAKSKLNKTIAKLDYSIKSIQATNPNRTDLIDSMQESKQDLVEVLIYWHELINDNRILNLHRSDLRNDNNKMIVRVSELEKMLSKAINNI
jgi:hypothetical protein